MVHQRRLLALMLVTAFTLPFAAGADDKRIGEDNSNWREHNSPSQGPLKNTVSGQHLGSAAPAARADRRIVLKPSTRYANVDRGETVTFVYGDKSFTWYFDTLGEPNFRLAEIAPKDFGTGHVQVYVGPNLSERG